MSPNVYRIFYLLNQTCDKTWIYFVYIWSSCREYQFSGWSALTLTFQFDLHFCSKILANLTAKWKTHDLTKPDNKIINHYGNWVIIISNTTIWPKVVTIKVTTTLGQSGQTKWDTIFYFVFRNFGSLYLKESKNVILKFFFFIDKEEANPNYCILPKKKINK